MLSIRPIAMVLAIMLVAALVPSTPASATIGVAAGVPHASVDIDGRWAIVGNGPSGTVWVLRYDIGVGWQEVASLVGAGEFGHAVAIDASDSLTNPYFVVSDPRSGNVFWYQFDGDGQEPGQVNQVVGDVDAGFGSSVDLTRNYLAVGAPLGGASAQGEVVLYERQFAGVLGQVQLTEPAADGDARIGSVVKVVDSTVYASAPFQGDEQEGVVFAFNTDGTLTETLKSENPAVDENFGFALDADPGRVLIAGNEDRVYLQQGLVQTEIPSAAGPASDVAISGNVLAIQVSNETTLLSENGNTGTFAAFETVSSNFEGPEIALDGGQLLKASQAPSPISSAEVLETSGYRLDIADKILPEVGDTRGNVGDYVDVDGLTMVTTSGIGSTAGEILVFEEQEGPFWVQSQVLDTPFDEAANAVAIHEDTIVALLDRGSGTNDVAIYTRTADTFVFDRAFSLPGDIAGRSIAINDDGTHLAIGQPSINSVVVYVVGPTRWGVVPPQQIVPTGAANENSNFGHDVDFGGASLIIGQPETSSLTAPAALPGKAEIWQDDGTGSYAAFSDLTPNTSAPGDSAGWAVAIDIGVNAIASPGLDSVEVRRSGLSDGFANPATVTGTNYGYALDLDAGVLAVSNWDGTTLAFDVAGTGISEITTFTASDFESGDNAASSFPVATYDGTIFTGARNEDEQGRDAGAIYTFNVAVPEPPRVPRTWDTDVVIDGRWAAVGDPVNSQVTILRNDGDGWTNVQTITSATAPLSFGAGLAMEGNRLYVGAPEAGNGVGTIYSYLRDPSGVYESGAEWAGTNQTDQFGSVIDVAGDWVVAGAPVDFDNPDGLPGTVLASDLDLVNPVVVGTSSAVVGVIDEYGAAVATSTPDVGTAPSTPLLWVGAPSADDGTGAVVGYFFDGDTWIETSTIVGDQPLNSRFGTAIDANGATLAVTAAPSEGNISYVETRMWSEAGVEAGMTRVELGVETQGIDMVFNGDVLAASSESRAEVQVWSNNGDTASPVEVGVLEGPTSLDVNGSSFDIDGLWMIASTGNFDDSPDWEDIATLTRIDSLGDIPNSPANKVVPEFGSDNDRFGSAVALDDNIYIVASPGGTATAGGGLVQIYDAATNDRLQVLDGGDAASFGQAIHLEGDQLAIGSENAVHIYDRPSAGAEFALTQVLTGTDGFGHSVDIDGDLLVVGAPFAPALAAGQARVFVRSGVTYGELAESPLTAPFTDGEFFGASVGVAGNVIVVSADPSLGGAIFGGEFASVSIFVRPDETAAFNRLPEEIFPSETVPGDLDGFGRSLEFDGSRLVVGAPLEDRNGAAQNENQGVIYVYDHAGNGVFTETAVLDPRNLFAGADHLNANWGTSVALSGDLIVAGGPGLINPLNNQGAVVHYAFDQAAGEWNPTAFVSEDGLADDADGGDRLGTSVAISGNAVIAGAAFEDVSGRNAGAVYRFSVNNAPVVEPDNKILAPAFSDPSDGEIGDLFGFATDTDGNRLVVGAPEWAEFPAPFGDVGSRGAGGVYVYQRDGDSWEFETFIANPDETAIESRFGEDVAIEQDTLVVGAPFTGGDDGTAWIFDLATGEQIQITPTDLDGSPTFGRSVDFAESTVVIGSPLFDRDAAGNVVANIGKIYVYNEDGTFIQEFYGDVPGGQYGRSLSMNENWLAVGSLDNGGPGLVDVYEVDNNGGFEFQQRLNGNGGQFGFAIDIDDLELIVGAPNAEQATIYTYNVDTQTWNEGQLLSPGPVDPGDRFGLDVSIAGTVAVVGEFGDDNDGTDEGRVHVFGITEDADWEVLESFVAPDASNADILGFSVEVLADGRIVAGAPFDDNNNGLNAGAIYLSNVTPPPPPPPPVDPATVSVAYELPETVMPGATSVTIEGATVASISGEDSTAVSGVVAASLGAIDFDEPPTGSSAPDNPLGNVTLADLGLDALGVEALQSIVLSEIPISIPGVGSWAELLEGTRFAGFPLQTVTLADVYGLANGESIVQSIPLRFADIEASPLRFADVAAAALGSIPIFDIDLDGDPATDSFTEWCDALALQATSCADLEITADTDATLGSLSAAGVSVEATPLRFAPLRFAYIEASPLRFAPLRFADIQASPLRFAPLRFAGIEASPLRFAPLRFAPLRFAPLRFAPLRFAPLRFADINATPLRFAPLRFATNPGNIADCTAIDCDSATFGEAADAGVLLDDFTLDDIGDTLMDNLRVEDILPGLEQDSIDALQLILDSDDTITIDTLITQFGIDGLGEITLGDLDPAIFELVELTIGDFFGGFTPEELDRYSIADFLLLFIPRSAYEWDEVDLGTINIQSAGLQAPITGSVAFVTSGGDNDNEVDFTITLPDTAVVDERSFTLAPTGASIRSATVTGGVAEVTVENAAPGVDQILQFNLLQGLSLGAASSAVVAEVDTNTASASDTVTIVEAFEPENNTLGGSVPVLANNLYLSHIGGPGDIDFYRITVTEPATSVSLRLGNLGADLDMVVYGPRLGSIVPDSGEEVASAPDAGAGGGTLSPVPLNDLPSSLDELQAYGASYFRGTEAEQIDFVAIEPGDYFVQITGYLGASSPDPYSLRAAVTPTVELPCPEREFPFTGGTVVGTSGSVSPAANTIVLLNRSRLELLYGPEEAQDIVDAAEAMVAFASSNGSGIVADILDVDALAGAPGAYSAWDASPCSVLAVNGVVSSIADVILGIRSTQNIDHLLVIGSDDVIPFGRVKDATSIANEQSYTNTFTSGSNNALRTAFSESFVLTDDPYADSAPAAIANTDRVIYVPEIAMGRLVETPTEIVGSLENFVTFNGQLDPQTGFVAGYDFLDDGAEETGDRLDELVSPGSVQRLINETWTAADLEAGLAAGPDTALVSAHFDHFNALPAAGNLTGTTNDLFDVTDAAGLDYEGAVLFSVGCHGGLSVSDVLVAPTGVVAQDWAQTFLGNGAAAFVGNTGYGYGDDTAVALSEALMAGFADGLNEYETVGEALLYAKQDYSADLTVYGAYDEKALMEATFYGIPFYRLSNTVVPEVVPDPDTDPAPTGGEAYTDSFDPVLEVDGDGTEDEVWSTPDEEGEPQVQVTNGYPILPRFQWEVTQQSPTNPDVLELEARGVVLESLVTRDEVNVDPATARAVFDLAANEPNTDATDVTFVLSPAVNTYLSPEGVRQNVNMAVGAFESTLPDGTGTMRLFESFDATVYYAKNPDGDRRKPVISEVQANPAGGTFNLSVRVKDDSPIVRTLALVTPMPLPNQPTTWQLLELEQQSGSLWTGDADLGSDTIQWLIMAVDDNGNTAWSMSKDLAFDGVQQTDFAPVLTNFREPTGNVTAGQTLGFGIDVTDFDGSDDSLVVRWDFGDGTTCTAEANGTCEFTAPTDSAPRGSTSSVHRYEEAGTYTVTVTATDASGLSDTESFEIEVAEPSSGLGNLWTIGNFRVGESEFADEDMFPTRSAGRRARVAAWIRSRPAQPDPFGFALFTVTGFRFAGDEITSIQVLNEHEAIVEGQGIRGLGDFAKPYHFRLYANDLEDYTRWEFWHSTLDDLDGPPRLRFTGENRGINVRPRN